ncbi:MAG TPA: hypothetical protein PKN04_14565 [bacterium]|nr:hypothetical protein [bacterium]HNT67003.1 hypothetical protein [bacterium]
MNRANPIIIKISLEEEMRIRQAVLDSDTNDALEIVKILLEKIDRNTRLSLKSHLDG